MQKHLLIFYFICIALSCTTSSTDYSITIFLTGFMTMEKECINSKKLLAILIVPLPSLGSLFEFKKIKGNLKNI